jgi:penicillin V acylase-like amidase (Ntn superfamily)
MKKIFFTAAATFFLTAAFGCFIMFLTDGKNIFVVNHEDWYARDAEVTFIPASGNKYGMVYFDFASEKLAQGGMNTEGLFFDGTKTPNAPYPGNDNKTGCNCYIWTKILEECKTVDEAIACVEKYKIPEIEDVHVLFADRKGNSAVVGVYKNKLQVHRRTGNYQLLTNFNLSSPSYGGEPKCLRYAAADSLLHIDSSATIGNMQKIMAQTNQEDLTVYSNIYNLTAGDVYIYSLATRKNFTNSVKLNLKKELKKGKHSVRIEKLFTNK